jgi:EAL domain-containing protein (putative c-di-GMP-specific phosphodiesterase class I)
LDLGSFALRTAVAAAVSWKRGRNAARQPFVTVNLSARQFQDPEPATKVEDVLRDSGLAPELLILEITESVTLFDTVETLKTVERLADLGVAIALDDFGTGYSSLSYLVRLRPRLIKIDQYFVSSPSDSSYNDALLGAIISLGDRLDMTMLAEGIETPEQFHRLRELRCTLGQGFLFSTAVPADEVKGLLKERFVIEDGPLTRAHHAKRTKSKHK